MKYAYALAALSGVASARDISLNSRVQRREVPGEHSHNPIVVSVDTSLKLNNPLDIEDSIFGLLGNAAAAEGAPKVANLDCLQQIIADQAFSNAKTAGDVDGQANAILYRALERNTGSVGLESVLCNETAKNPEIAAITQHQDPASKGAKGNKQIALNVAKQLKSIGADPNLAIKSGTFAPGKIGDPTGRGNACDVADDVEGCIFSQNLLVPDVTEAEITAFLASAAKRAAAGNNVQTFTGALGGAPPPVIESSGDRPFSVNGDTFVNKGAALQRSCSVQHNACATAANAKKLSGGVAQCETQEDACNAAGGVKKVRAAAGKNVQTFTGALGGAPPPVVETSGDRPFSVNGDTFVNKGAALQRSCSVQHNACATAANEKKISGGVAQCETQENACNAAGGVKKVRAAAGKNVQTFTGALGGAPPPVIESSGDRPFSVNGDTFVNKGAAIQRSCSVQHNACATAANEKKIAGGVAQCETQENACNAAAGGKKARRVDFRAAVRAAASEFGSCSNPAIQFSDNNADRKGAFAFAPVDTNEFAHGSALNIGVITNFICGQLGSKCKAGAATVDKCNAAAKDAAGQKDAAAADAFNKALGV